MDDNDIGTSEDLKDNTLFVASVIRNFTLHRFVSPTKLRKAYLLILQDQVTQRDVLLGALFASLQTKEPTFEEVLALIDAALELDGFCGPTKGLSFGEDVYNICGSGKDDIKTFNVSTVAAIIASSTGMAISKNGSTSTSSTAGSCDLLEELGVNIKVDKETMIKCLINEGIAFFDIQSILPCYDKQYGGKLFFPHPLSYGFPGLINPIKIKGIVYGVANLNTELTTKVLTHFGIDSVLVACGMNKAQKKYIDEFSIFGPTKVTEVKNGNISSYWFHPNQIGVHLAKEFDVLQEDSVRKAAIGAVRVLSGHDHGAKEDFACINSGAIMYIGNMVELIEKGYLIAKNAIYSGKAIEKLQNLVIHTKGDQDRLARLMLLSGKQ